MSSYTTFWMMTIYSDTLQWSGITPIFDPFTDLDLITKFDFLLICEMFPQNICNGCGMPTEDAYSSGHLVLSHCGTWEFQTSLGTSGFFFFLLLTATHVPLQVDKFPPPPPVKPEGTIGLHSVRQWVCLSVTLVFRTFLRYTFTYLDESWYRASI